MPLVAEHGDGCGRADHRRGGSGADGGVEGAGRRPARSQSSPDAGGWPYSDILRRLPDLPQSLPARRRRAGTHWRPSMRSRQVTAKYPGIHTTLGVSNVSFGLNPAARQVLNSVFLARVCQQAGLDSGIVPAARILPLARIPDEQRKVAEDLVYDRRSARLRPARRGSWRCSRASRQRTAPSEARAAETGRTSGNDQRLRQRIIDGDAEGLVGRPRRGADHQTRAGDHQRRPARGHEGPSASSSARGKMQLPFVLASAEVMKAAVALSRATPRQGGRGQARAPSSLPP